MLRLLSNDGRIHGNGIAEIIRMEIAADTRGEDIQIQRPELGLGGFTSILAGGFRVCEFVEVLAKFCLA